MSHIPVVQVSLKTYLKINILQAQSTFENDFEVTCKKTFSRFLEMTIYRYELVSKISKLLDIFKSPRLTCQSISALVKTISLTNFTQSLYKHSRI